MKLKIKIWIIILGLLIGALSYWRIPYDEMNMANSDVWLFVGTVSLIGAFVASYVSNQASWKVALLISLGVIISIVLRIIYDTTFIDSTSHNLAPFEVAFAGLQSLPAAFIGSYLGKYIKKFKK